MFPRLYDASVTADDIVIVTQNTRMAVLSELTESQLNWARNEPRHYKYVLIYTTYFMCMPSCGPNEVEVKDGEIISARFLGRSGFDVRKGEPLPEKYWQALSIHWQLNELEKFVESAEFTELAPSDRFDQTWVHIEYDPILSFPTLIRRNDPMDNHGNHTTRIGYFEVIEE